MAMQSCLRRSYKLIMLVNPEMRLLGRINLENSWYLVDENTIRRCTKYILDRINELF
jgi:hypothetical protein